MKTKSEQWHSQIHMQFQRKGEQKECSKTLRPSLSELIHSSKHSTDFSADKHDIISAGEQNVNA